MEICRRQQDRPYCLGATAIEIFDPASGQSLIISNITRSAEEFEQGSPATAEALPPAKTGAPGRPTSMHLIEQEFHLRVAAGQICDTLQAESEYLLSWLRQEHPLAPQPTLKTIKNRLRVVYRN